MEPCRKTSYGAIAVEVRQDRLSLYKSIDRQIDEEREKEDVKVETKKNWKQKS